MNKEIDPDLLARLEEVTGEGKSKAPELTPEQEEKLREWERKAKDQSQRLANMTPKERKAYGFKPGQNLGEKRRDDELNYPSK